MRVRAQPRDRLQSKRQGRSLVGGHPLAGVREGAAPVEIVAIDAAGAGIVRWPQRRIAMLDAAAFLHAV